MTDIASANLSGDHAEPTDGTGFFWAFVILLLAAWAGSIAVLGVPGIVLPALVLVPVTWVIIVLLTWG
ncbi:hypothetical protein [Jhaorihella thermophila]|uniref:Uncharacterized protein n=1 Tax=Jhaorihella thermophila TaxID=488547 RepID=A0A1H5U041_9RHOB|nr:hypothetical protein [Jhaorihella thermophila]SEF67647.1 hypothetical protein SAMN05421751_10389 [Jhaorihella thermophila]